MEDALRDFGNSYSIKEFRAVLILVLMEDALRVSAQVAELFNKALS